MKTLKKALDSPFLGIIILLIGIAVVINMPPSPSEINSRTKTIKIHEVIDGDTYYTISNEDTTWLRLADVDCAESHTEAGKRATKYVENLIEGKRVKAEYLGKGYYDRTLVKIWINNNESLSSRLLKKRLATYYN